MALQGLLEEFNIVAVLQMAAGARMSGSLTVEAAPDQAQVRFCRGQVVAAQASFAPDRLGEILQRTRRISAAAWITAEQRRAQDAPAMPMRTYLREQGLATLDDLVMAEQIQILETMSQLLLWSRGRWRFVFGPAEADAPVPAGALSVDEILSGQVLMLEASDAPPPAPAHPTTPLPITVDLPAPLLPTPSGNGNGNGHHAAEATVLALPPTAAPPPPPAEAPVPPPVVPPPISRVMSVPGTGTATTLLVPEAALEEIRGVLMVLLARSEGKEVCLIDTSGSPIARQGGAAHSRYPQLFALAAGIFASWQELGRCLGEGRASTLVYQGYGVNMCLTPVGTQAVLMTLYQQTSNSGLVNFWNRQASVRLARVLALPDPPPPAEASLVDSSVAADAAASLAGALADATFTDDLARQLDILFGA